MCGPLAIPIVMMAMSAAAAASNASEGAKTKGAMTDYQRKQQNEIVKQANFAENDQKLATVDKNDEARRQLTEVNLQTIRNQGIINSAIGESGLAGNSMDRLKNSVANDASAQRMNVLDNYERDYQAIFANRVGSSENSKAAVRGAGGSRYKVNNIANALNIVSSGSQGYAAGNDMVAANKGNSANRASVINGGTR